MQQETALIWSWLNILTKKRYDALVAVFGGLDRALTHVDEELLKKLGCRQETILRTLTRLDEFDPAAYARELTKRSLELITIEDDRYPARLQEIGDPPIFLYARGDITVTEQPCIGMVGTRTMSAYGKRVTEAFVGPFVRAGMVTLHPVGLPHGPKPRALKAFLEGANPGVHNEVGIMADFANPTRVSEFALSLSRPE